MPAIVAAAPAAGTHSGVVEIKPTDMPKPVRPLAPMPVPNNPEPPMIVDPAPPNKAPIPIPDANPATPASANSAPIADVLTKVPPIYPADPVKISPPEECATKLAPPASAGTIANKGIGMIACPVYCARTRLVVDFAVKCGSNSCQRLDSHNSRLRLFLLTNICFFVFVHFSGHYIFVVRGRSGRPHSIQYGVRDIGSSKVRQVRSTSESSRAARSAARTRRRG